MLKCDAWRVLSSAATRVYIQIGSRYNGANNGKLAFSVRDAASECNLAINTARRALHELVDLGFIEETRHGGLSKKTRIASEWRLTAFKCDLTGGFKTCAFLQRGELARTYRANYSRGSVYQTRSASVSKEITACLKRGAEMSPTVLNEITDTP
jgi:Helix-turn-helix domain